MTRRQWVWLWIWLLLFFIIFCVWNKIQTFTNNSKTENQPITNATSIPVTTTMPKQMTTKVEDTKDINLKIVKEDKMIKISGLFTSKEDLEKLKSTYLNNFDQIEEDFIVIDKEANNSKIIEMVSSLSGDFAKFRNGYLEYANGEFTIDGIVDDLNIKRSIGDKALVAGNIIINNKVTINELQTKEVEKSQKESLIKIQEKLNNLLKVKNVEFVFTKAKLTKNGKKTVDDVYTILSQYKNIKIEVGGHTDSIGTRKNNKALSQNRANVVKSYLVSKGIKSESIKAIGYGESKPLVNNNSSKNRQINRRVEFKILGE